MQVGLKQRTKIDTLRGVLTDLLLNAEAAQVPVWLNLIDRLDAWTVSISVVGQVKSGKSSLLNAMLRQPELLPSNETPCTSVITNVYLNAPRRLGASATFEFFSEEDWQEVQERASQALDLAEERVFGFDGAQVNASCRTAEWLTASRYRSLLGSRHDFDFVSPELLARYVCTSRDRDAVPLTDAPECYAAITRAAHVYLDQPDFRVPVCLKDTPGLNDPNLFRNAVTCGALDTSTIFLVVISAHQPMTDADLSLIRSVARDPAKSVILFVNRLDEVEDYPRRAPEIVTAVRARLDFELPCNTIRVIAGSAFFADIADNPMEEAGRLRLAHHDEALRRYLVGRNAVLPEDEAGRFRAASGVPDLLAALSDLIDCSQSEKALDQMLFDTRLELEAFSASVDRQHSLADRALEAARRLDSGQPATEVEAELVSLTSMRDGITQTLTELDGAIGRIQSVAARNLREDLRETVVRFVEADSDETPLSNDRLLGGQATAIDLKSLSWAMERAASVAYQTACDVLDGLLRQSRQDCYLAASACYDVPATFSMLSGLPNGALVSTSAAQRQSVEFGSAGTSGWLARLRGANRNRKARERLKEIALAEMQPVLNGLTRAFDTQFTERARSGQQRISVFGHLVEQGLRECAARLSNAEDFRQEAPFLSATGEGSLWHLERARNHWAGKAQAAERARLELLTVFAEKTA